MVSTGQTTLEVFAALCTIHGACRVRQEWAGRGRANVPIIDVHHWTACACMHPPSYPQPQLASSSSPIQLLYDRTHDGTAMKTTLQPAIPFLPPA